MTFSEILNLILGGGVLALVLGVITLKATVRKANAEAAKAIAEAEKARADAESVHITNTENATRILVQNIVRPLKEELNATREDLKATKREMASTKREMARLRKAVEAASGCPHSEGCPVIVKLRDNQKDTDIAGPNYPGRIARGVSPESERTGEPDGDSRIRGQPA